MCEGIGISRDRVSVVDTLLSIVSSRFLVLSPRAEVFLCLLRDEDLLLDGSLSSLRWLRYPLLSDVE